MLNFTDYYLKAKLASLNESFIEIDNLNESLDATEAEEFKKALEDAKKYNFDRSEAYLCAFIIELDDYRSKLNDIEAFLKDNPMYALEWERNNNADNSGYFVLYPKKRNYDELDGFYSKHEKFFSTPTSTTTSSEDKIKNALFRFCKEYNAENGLEPHDRGAAYVSTDYSGRFMYGKLCYGIVAPNSARDDLAIFLAENGLKSLTKDMKIDNMGLDMIFYFPSVNGDIGGYKPRAIISNIKHTKDLGLEESLSALKTQTTTCEVEVIIDKTSSDLTPKNIENYFEAEISNDKDFLDCEITLNTIDLGEFFVLTITVKDKCEYSIYPATDWERSEIEYRSKNPIEESTIKYAIELICKNSNFECEVNGIKTTVEDLDIELDYDESLNESKDLNELFGIGTKYVLLFPDNKDHHKHMYDSLRKAKTAAETIIRNNSFNHTRTDLFTKEIDIYKVDPEWVEIIEEELCGNNPLEAYNKIKKYCKLVDIVEASKSAKASNEFDKEWNKKYYGKEYVLSNESLAEDTVKTKDGKWTNKGDEGTHGKFRTKKEADTLRRAMFANGYKG